MRKSTKITDKEFKKMLDEVGPKKMIGRHIRWIITLSDKQINELIKRKVD